FAAAAALVGIAVIAPAIGPKGNAEELALAKRQSAQLESALSDFDAEGRVMSGREAELTARLEDQIAALDGRLVQLNDPALQEGHLVDLWRQRVNLMQQLVEVRVTRAQYVGL
ncbi:MAG: hypothetical protein ACREMF_02860, partial [Gemmatimonadales bacterium]